MIKEGFADYLTKPVNLRDMEQMLLKYLPEDKVLRVEDREDAADFEPDRASDDAAIVEAIERIRGISTKEGLEYCGDAEDYADALLVYSESAGQKAARLNELASEKDMENYSLLVHSVKSTSKAVGALELAEHAAKLEALSREGNVEAVMAKTTSFTEDYERLGREIGTIINQKGN